MFCGTNNILQNVPHIQTECEEYFAQYHQLDRIFLTFSLQNSVGLAKHYYGSE